MCKYFESRHGLSRMSRQDQPTSMHLLRRQILTTGQAVQRAGKRADTQDELPTSHAQGCLDIPAHKGRKTLLATQRFLHFRLKNMKTQCSAHIFKNIYSHSPCSPFFLPTVPTCSLLVLNNVQHATFSNIRLVYTAVDIVVAVVTSFIHLAKRFFKTLLSQHYNGT